MSRGTVPSTKVMYRIDLIETISITRRKGPRLGIFLGDICAYLDSLDTLDRYAQVNMHLADTASKAQGPAAGRASTNVVTLSYYLQHEIRPPPLSSESIHSCQFFLPSPG